MRNNIRVHTPLETAIISRNLKAIEKELGHSIPSGSVSIYDLEKVLGPVEVDNIVRNIRSLENHSTTGTIASFISGIFTFILLIVVFICFIQVL